jgi:transposase
LFALRRAGENIRTLASHLDEILAYCRHKVRLGVVEAINRSMATF